MTLNLIDVFRIDFRTSAEADALNTALQKSLKLDYRYQPARLGLALSLADPAPPPVATDLIGKPIRGETLFGQEEGEMALWVALLYENSILEHLTKKDLTELVAAHWHRGLNLLANSVKTWEGRPHTLLLQLAGE